VTIHSPLVIEMSKSDSKRINLQAFKSFLAGTSSGVAKLVVGHPLDTIKVRLQMEGGYKQGGKFKGPIDCLIQTIKTEGLKGLYKGGTPPFFGWTIIDSVMFGTYVNVKTYLQKETTIRSPFTHAMISGLIAGWTCSFVVCPIEQVKARLQIQYSDPTSIKYKGPIDCIRSLVRNNGILGLYKGFSGTLMFRSFVSLYFAAYEQSMRLLTPMQMITPVKNFMAGGLAATTLWLVAYPTDVIKNKLMAQPDTKPLLYNGVIDCIKKIYLKEGMKGFYRGFAPCIIRSFPANGAAFLSFEFVMRSLS